VLFLVFVVFIAFNQDFINLDIGKHLFHLLYSESKKKDEVAIFEENFESIKKILPLHGTVGYLDNQFGGLKDVRKNIVLAMYYYRTQYTLAPVVVEYNHTRQFMIGNFMMDKPSAKLINSPYNVLNDFDNGIFWIKRKPL